MKESLYRFAAALVLAIAAFVVSARPAAAWYSCSEMRTYCEAYMGTFVEGYGTSGSCPAGHIEWWCCTMEGCYPEPDDDECCYQ